METADSAPSYRKLTDSSFGSMLSCEFFSHSFSLIEAWSASILPLPDALSRTLEKFIHNRGHSLMVQARKPLKNN
jgi:hypothetical protein